MSVRTDSASPVSSGPAPGRPAGRRRPDPTTLLVLSAWIYVLVPRVAQSFLAPKNRLGVGDPVPYVASAGLIELACRLLLVGCCLAILVSRRKRLPTDRRVALLVLLTPWFYVVTRDLYLDQRPNPTALLYPLVVITVWVLRPPLQRLAVIGLAIVGTALASMAMAVIDPAKGIFTSAAGEIVAAEKELIPLGLLVGPFQGANNLGRVLMLGVPLIALVRVSVTTRVLLFAPVLFALVWSSSRSSLTAIVVCAAVAAVVLAFPAGSRVVVAMLLTGVTALVGVMLPLVTTDPAAYTNRGVVWTSSLQQWEANPVFGLGTDWYARAAQYGDNVVSTAFHGHNQFVHVLVTAGLVGVGIAAGVMAYVIVISARWATRGSVVPVAYLTALLVSCVLEVSFGLVDRDSLLMSSTLAVAIILLADRRPAAGCAVPFSRPG